MDTAQTRGMPNESVPDDSDSDMGEVDEEDLESSLSELLETETLRWVFVGGKGGVGKTTTSCSVGIEFAKRRDKVLILSTDPAHNLSDAFGQKFSNTPIKVNGFHNLFAMELDASFQESMRFTTKTEGGAFGLGDGLQKLIPQIVSALPGIDEALGFAELMQSVQSFDYSVIVFDTAPTGHTLRLLSFPDVVDTALRKLSSYSEQIFGTLKMVNMMAGQSMDVEELHNKFDEVKAVTTSVRETFKDPARTTFVCVCIPEFLSVYETERLVQELARQSIDCSNIVVNQVIFPAGDGLGFDSRDGMAKLSEIKTIHPPEEMIVNLQQPAGAAPAQLEQLQSENCELRNLVGGLLVKMYHLEKHYYARRKMQMKYLDQITDLYASDFHVVCMPLQPEEVRGVDKLRSFGELLLDVNTLPPPPPPPPLQTDGMRC